MSDDPLEYLGPDPTAQITNQRRSALAEAYAYRDLFGAYGSAVVAGLFAYHDRLPGPTGAPATPLPLNTPSRAVLVAGHYSAIEDFDGATVDELTNNLGLGEAEAAAALRALGHST